MTQKTIQGSASGKSSIFFIRRKPFINKGLHRLTTIWVICLGTFLLTNYCDAKSASTSKTVKVVLAEKDEAKFPIIISKSASKTTLANAKTLASYLQKITGAKFTVKEGDGSTGIVLGRQDEFSALAKQFDSDPKDPRRTEEYLLYTHPKGLLLTGASDLGAQNAMWDFLGRQGYRQYFPGPAWEIIPTVPKMTAKYNDLQKPDYIMRSVWFSGGAYPESKKRYHDWCKKNRQVSGFFINAGHSYEKFIHRNKKQFLEHPEYYALVGGVRRGGKLNVANPDLRKLFVEYNLKKLRRRPKQLSVSVDPSDGGNWDESKEAKAIGSPSNQAVFLANEVAKAIEKEFPGRYVGMYAYNKHGAPPTIKVHPNVFVLVTTGFRGTTLSLKEQMEGWQKQGATLGIRDYLSYPAANYDIPNRCRGPFGFPTKAFKKYYELGARLYSGESGNNWGINGLVYYSISRLLWDVNDTKFTDTLFEEFLKNCFGPVAEDIRPYYEAISPAGNPVLESSLFRQLYDAINAARSKNPGKAIEARLDALTVYARYLELNKAYVSKSGAARCKAAREMFSHLYRARFHSANAAYAVIRDLRVRDKTIKKGWTKEESQSLRRGTPPWEKRKPYERDEILAMVSEGIKNNKKLDFKPVSYSKNLIPAASILSKDKNVKPGQLGNQNRHGILYYTWAKKSGTEWRIKITCGNAGRRRIPQIRPKIELWAVEEAMDEAVDIAEMPIKNGQVKEFVLKSPHKGLHWIILNGARWQKLELDPSKPWTVTSLTDLQRQSQGVMSTSTLYFYVPKGTKLIGGYFKGRGTLINPRGQAVKKFNHDGYVKIDVPKGMDGRLWKVDKLRGGNFLLLTVPSYFAPSPKDLLLPSEVVEKELKK